MRKIILGLGFFFLIFPFTQAQKTLSLEDAVTGQWSKFKPKSLNTSGFKGSSDTLVYLDNYTSLKAITPSNATPVILMDLSDVNALMKAEKKEKMDYFPYNYEWADGQHIYFEQDHNVYFVNLTSKTIVHKIKLNDAAELVEIHADSRRAAFNIQNNIYISIGDTDAVAVTHDTDLGIVNGSDYTHRQEFGINKGMFWSPQGHYLAWYRKDETMVTEYPLTHTDTRIAEVAPIRYPMAGMTSEQVTLGVYEVSTGETIFIKTGLPADQFLTAISWDPSEKYVYIGLLNREQNHLQLNKYDISTGNKIQTLFEEKNDRYVEPENPLYFLKTKPNQFLWFSERDGFNHLYLYQTDGKLIRQVTKGLWEVTEIIGLDAREENLFFMRTQNQGLDRQLCVVSLSSGKITQLTNEPGSHECKVSNDGRFIFDQYSSTTVPSAYTFHDRQNKIKFSPVVSENPLTDYNLPKAELLSITAADGKTPLNARIIKPSNFDAAKTYPVLVYVYGGPHAQLVTNSWLTGARLWDYYMAQEGYIVFTLDNRGSAHRGFEFESVIHRQLGKHEMEDQMKGLSYLYSLPYVDSARIGLHGWSFGGFMTLSLVLNYPGVFKAAVAGGPVTDWKYYEVMYGERYMDTPDENPDGYANTSVIAKAGALQDHTLVIHGAQDDVVVMQHSLEFIKACIKQRRQVDFFVYPDHKHNVIGRDRIHLMQKITDYLRLYLEK